MKPAENARECIDRYTEKKPPERQPVAQALRRLVKSTVKGSSESANPWKIPTFESNGPMCMRMISKNHVTFGFFRGTSRPDLTKLREGSGRHLRHGKLRTMHDSRKRALKKLIVEAAKLHDAEPVEGMKCNRPSS
jgi:hypothetical protein